MKRLRSVIGLGAMLILSGASFAQVQPGLSAEEVQGIAQDAYLYGYPLVLMDVTRLQFTNYRQPTGISVRGPANRFIHSRRFPDATSRAVIRVNKDTLYSSAWLDLQDEPVVLSQPKTDRYFMLPMLDMWSDVIAVPGTRTTGGGEARTFLVAGPGWNGKAPAGMELIKSPTRYLWIAGRTQVNGTTDYEAVHKVQDGFRIVPLSGWGKADYTPAEGRVLPGVDPKTEPPVQVAGMDAATFYGRMSELLRDNPPHAADYPMLHRLARLGFAPGKPFDLAALPAAARLAIEGGYQQGKARLAAERGRATGEGAKGWVYQTDGGAYGVNYRYRAAIAACCLGYNLPQDAIYPSIAADSAGKPLDGRHRYVLHFSKAELPPVNAFWSVTAYDANGYFMPNALDRFAVGDRDKLTFNADGSLDLYLQADSPGSALESNWLPVGAAPFNLLLRLYWPKDAVLDRTWVPPLPQGAGRAAT